MRLIHNVPFTPGEVEFYRGLVFTNVVQGMRSIISVMDGLGVKVQDENVVSSIEDEFHIAAFV